MSVSAVAPACPNSGRSGRCRVRVLVLDDEEIVHWGFRLLLANQPWAERCIPARDAASALQLAWRFEPHVALIDTGTLDGSPAEFCRELAHACAQAKILLLTHAEAVAPSTIRAVGASGFVSHSWAARDLLQAIRRTSAGLAVAPCRPPAQSNLSPRQQEILQLIAGGATNSEIAVRLYLSRDTVKQHTSALYRKLGARNRTHAVQTARRQGLIAV